MVAQRLAACVNILPGMVSHYWWGRGRARRRGGDDRQDARLVADRVRKAIKELTPIRRRRSW